MRTLNAARAIYSRLPGDILLWLTPQQSVVAERDHAVLEKALRAHAE